MITIIFQEAEATEEEKKSKNVQAKIAKRQRGQKLDPHLEDQFASGRLFACISSRPGQCGRSDGYVIPVAFILLLSYGGLELQSRFTYNRCEIEIFCPSDSNWSWLWRSHLPVIHGMLVPLVEYEINS